MIQITAFLSWFGDILLGEAWRQEDYLRKQTKRKLKVKMLKSNALF